MACLLFVMLLPLSKIKSIPIFRVLLSICSCLLIRAQALFFQPEYCNSSFSCKHFFTPLLQCRHCWVWRGNCTATPPVLFSKKKIYK